MLVKVIQTHYKLQCDRCRATTDGAPSKEVLRLAVVAAVARLPLAREQAAVSVYIDHDTTVVCLVGNLAGLTPAEVTDGLDAGVLAFQRARRHTVTVVSVQHPTLAHTAEGALRVTWRIECMAGHDEAVHAATASLAEWAAGWSARLASLTEAQVTGYLEAHGWRYARTDGARTFWDRAGHGDFRVHVTAEGPATTRAVVRLVAAVGGVSELEVIAGMMAQRRGR